MAVFPLCAETQGLFLSFISFPFFPQGPFPQPSQAPQVLFIVLVQAWGCQAKTWHTKGQLHVSQSCPFLCNHLTFIK